MRYIYFAKTFAILRGKLYWSYKVHLLLISIELRFDLRMSVRQSVFLCVARILSFVNINILSSHFAKVVEVLVSIENGPSRPTDTFVARHELRQRSTSWVCLFKSNIAKIDITIKISIYRWSPGVYIKIKEHLRSPVTTTIIYFLLS